MSKGDFIFITIIINLVLICLLIGVKRELNRQEQQTTYKVIVETHRKGLNPLGLTNPAKENKRR